MFTLIAVENVNVLKFYISQRINLQHRNIVAFRNSFLSSKNSTNFSDKFLSFCHYITFPESFFCCKILFRSLEWFLTLHSCRSVCWMPAQFTLPALLRCYYVTHWILTGLRIKRESQSIWFHLIFLPECEATRNSILPVRGTDCDKIVKTRVQYITCELYFALEIINFVPTGEFSE